MNGSQRLLWCALALANTIALLVHWQSGGWFYGADGSVYAHDYISHWAAGQRVLRGQAALVYNEAAQIAFQTALIDASKPVKYGFYYPPHFLFSTVPFSRLELVPAYVAFLCVTIGLYVFALRLITPDWVTAALAAVAGGGSYFSLLYVQNGFLTAALLTASLALLPARPRIAGIMLGMLTIKPQLGLLIPLVLALTGYWRTIGWAAGTALLMAILAELVFGPGIWSTFLSSSSQTTGFLEAGTLWFKMQSPFAFGLPLFGSVGAYALHLAIAAAAALAVVWIWCNADNSHWLKGAALIAGTLLMPPYLFAYDAVAITGAALMLVRENPNLPLSDRVALILACILPGFANTIFSVAVPMAAVTILVLVLRQVERGSNLHGPSKLGVPEVW